MAAQFMTDFEMATEGGEGSLVTFQYLKNAAFRVVHADGVIGSATPAGNLHVAFFSERPPFPRKLTHTVNADGSLGPHIPEKTDIREGIIREIDFDVVMSQEVAEALLHWLTSQITSLKAAKRATEAEK
jgi:hypothetical protein